MAGFVSQSDVIRLDRGQFIKAAGAAALAVGIATTPSARPSRAWADEGSAAAGEAAGGGSGAQTFRAVEPSMKGDIEVFVTLAGGAITDIAVLDEVDTPVICDAAIESVCARIVEQQNVEVDAAAGATMTSMAIKAGVSDALAAAGLDLTAFQKGSDAVAQKAAGEDESWDVVIVGSGMAGLSAAIKARRENPDLAVLVLEKEAYTGGSTRVCGGGLWAMGAAANETIGQDCSLDDYVSFMQDWSEPTELNTNLMASIHEVSGDTFDYLYDWGLPVNATGWSLGNPKAQLPVFWSTAGQATSWETGNSGIADFMATRATNDGAQIRLNSRVTGLMTDADGGVVGVRVEDLTSTYAVEARKVILATGGFTRNAELIEQYAPDYADAFAFTGAGSTGDGLVMATELGASVVGEGMMGLFGLGPNLGYYGPYGNLVWQAQVTVNSAGEEFGVDEAFYGKTLRLLLDQEGACGYGIADATNAVRERFDEAVDAGQAAVGRYETLEELAADRGIDAEALVQTCAARGIAEAPFYCVVKRPLFIGSIPGLKVSASCEVLGGGEEPIANLYAAGELIFGNVFANAYPCSGTGVGTSCYTGAIAAQAAVGGLA